MFTQLICQTVSSTSSIEATPVVGVLAMTPKSAHNVSVPSSDVKSLATPSLYCRTVKLSVSAKPNNDEAAVRRD